MCESSGDPGALSLIWVGTPAARPSLDEQSYLVRTSLSAARTAARSGTVTAPIAYGSHCRCSRKAAVDPMGAATPQPLAGVRGPELCDALPTPPWVVGCRQCRAPRVECCAAVLDRLDVDARPTSGARRERRRRCASHVQRRCVGLRRAPPQLAPLRRKLGPKGASQRAFRSRGTLARPLSRAGTPGSRARGRGTGEGGVGELSGGRMNIA